MKKINKVSLLLFGIILLSLSFLSPTKTEAQSSYCYSSDFTCTLYWEKIENGVLVENEVITFADMRNA